MFLNEPRLNLPPIEVSKGDAEMKLFFMIMMSMALIAFPVESRSAEDSNASDNEGMVMIQGVLVNSTGSSVAGTDVFIFELTKEGALKLSTSGNILDNSGMTDKDGFFKIKVARSFLENHQAVLLVQSWEGVKHPGKTPLVISLPGESNIVDLGKIEVAFK